MSNKEISKRLKLARINAGFRFARSFSEYFNIPYITYSQHESGKRTIKPEVILKYAEYLNISAAWLLTGCDNNNHHVAKSILTDSIIDVELLLNISREVKKMSDTMDLKLLDNDITTISSDIYNLLQSNSNPSGFGLFKLIVDKVSEIKLNSKKIA
ncbi:Helix-turn-helix domain protein (plasmid) [Piscirickettsia salmonis]|uniref:helix-turn-helix domain-containing protein n=1 Tax=Piscirickettsia salmonis TaxID=1238 RepID=UPI0012BB17A1|nr:helix-turn-helix transcriptional regulator [Piscirickettsia salmonis]QGP56874.1 Helix-turn-helix domain protein [Piscirickettsia salmonis]QGP62172.1 Helix-turn-helix domain protein [Piscirickettsia salmonis]QGP66927.1 Helix-turn-helix domain protein [Piscirickettsia salmonis]